MKLRSRPALLEACPEAKLLFAAQHDPRCAYRCPSARLLGAPLAEWKEMCGGADGARAHAECHET